MFVLRMSFVSHHFFLQSFGRLGLAPLLLIANQLTVLPDANSATIEKAKGNQALIIYEEGETLPAVGDKLFAVEDGKRKAILEVKGIKGLKAKVSVRKGQVFQGMEVRAAKPAKSAPKSAVAAAASEPVDPSEAEPTEAPTRAEPKKRKKKAQAKRESSTSRSALSRQALFTEMTAGGTVSYAMNSQIVASNGSTQSMSGSGFGARGFVDLPISEWLSVLARGGIEQFNVSGGRFGTATGATEIMYGVADLLGKVHFDFGDFRPFVLGGLGLHFPLSKSSNVLSVNAISATTVFIGGGGFNYAFSNDMYFQLTAEYGMFPPSNDVTTSIIAVRTGIGFAL